MTKRWLYYSSLPYPTLPSVLSDLFLHLPQLAGLAEHVLYTASFAAEGAMVDLLGREVRGGFGVVPALFLARCYCCCLFVTCCVYFSVTLTDC